MAMTSFAGTTLSSGGDGCETCSEHRLPQGVCRGRNKEASPEMETIVVSASKGVMNSLLAKLAALMGEEFKKFKGVRKQVSFLKDELSTMNSFLEMLDLVDELNPLAKEWRSHVREMAYDIEDCIDYFMHHLGNANPKKDFIKKTACRLKTLRHRHHIAHQIDELKARVLEASERRTRYMLDELACISGSVPVDPRVHALYTEAENLVGIDGPREQLVEWLTKTEQQLRVLSIVGFGGLGKTTLAKEVYHNIGQQFSCKVFVSVSQRPDMTRLLNGIQHKLGTLVSSSTSEVSDIIDSIREYLKDRRYFIVVDDLWDAKAWDIISCAFPENRAGSRVIVTTRLEEVASRACGFHRECIYRMKPLSNQDARMLFFNRIFGCENDRPSQFEEISAEILNKCGGLPLAIITIAGLLASRPVNLKDWECILNSLSMQFGTNATLERVREILDLSYKNLPHHLKACLLYLSLYPEDYEIKRDDLIRQWVSEGFVSNLHGQDSYDVAKSYFNELINRSLVQPESTDLGEVLSCRVHDMMMDLILCKCEEDNFVTVAYNSEGVARHHDRKVRRLSLSCSDVDDTVAVGAIPGIDATSLSHIRSLAMHGKFYYMPHLLMFKYLRVLIINTSFSTSTFMLDLTCITQLFLLKYLKIDLSSQSHLPTVQLPHKIRGLVYLEMLEIKHCYLERLPSDIIYLPCLSHLTVDLCCNLIDGLHNMKSLHTLVGYPLELDRNIRCLGALRELRVLTFKTTSTTYGHSTNKEWMDAFLTSLGKLRNLRYLEVNDGSLGAFGRGNHQLNSLSHPPLHLEQLLLWGWRLSRIPRWINGDLKKLCRLSLVIMDTSTEEVRVLGELPSLIDLQLDMHDAPHWRRIRPRPMIVFGVGSFPALEDLDFHYGNDATSSMCFEAPGVLPQLRRLTLRLWTHSWGGATPVGMEHLLNLQHIHLVQHYWGQQHWIDDDSYMVCFFTNYSAQVHPSRPSLSTECEAHNKRPLVKA